MHTCSCLFSLLHVAITALLCRAYNGSGRGYVRKIYRKQLLYRAGSFPSSPAPMTQSTPQASATWPGSRETSAHKECLFLPVVWFLFNPRMQLRIHRRDMQPSQGEHADTAHCCVGVDALHEVCCGNVWERGEKSECPRMRSNGNSHILYSITL